MISPTNWTYHLFQVSDASSILFSKTIHLSLILTTLSLCLGTALSQSTNRTLYALKEGPLDTNWTKSVGLNPWPEYPRPQLKRAEWLNLNGIWQFKAAQNSSEIESPPFGPDGFDREILVPFCVESAIGGIMEIHSHMWYRRTFKIPQGTAWKGNVLLNFGAVDYEGNQIVGLFGSSCEVLLQINSSWILVYFYFHTPQSATVFLNQERIHFHCGGYVKFSIEIMNLKPVGQENELLVFVYDPSDKGGVLSGESRPLSLLLRQIPACPYI